MAKLWQLKKLSDGSALNEPQPLPENWGPIFGLKGVEDQLSNLSWLGEPYSDLGWSIVGEEPPPPPGPSESEIVWEQAKKLLIESDWSMLSDVPMASGKKAEWIEYRRQLREIRLHPDFPHMIWPVKPE